MSVKGINHISEYNRQYKWHDLQDLDPVEVLVAGCPSYKELKTSEPPLQAKQRPTLELARAEDVTEDPVQPFGSPSKDLHITREPSFTKKKRVPGASPERPKINKSLAKKSGMAVKTSNSALYESEYSRTYSPKKGTSAAVQSSPLQSTKSMFLDSKTNLPIGKKPVDKKMQSEYSSRYADPTIELNNIRKIYQEQIRRKQLELEKSAEQKAADIPHLEKVPEPAPKTAILEPTEPAKVEKKLKLKVVCPLRGDRPKVKATYDIISPQKPAKVYWQSEYKSKYESPEKETSFTPSAYGKRSHPYKLASPDKVSDLMKPDDSEAACAEHMQKNSASWFDQVLELRTLAEKYKAKSHGSHFSPNNMVQLAFSSARLRDKPDIISASASEESVKIVPRAPKLPKEKLRSAVEKDLKLTDIEIQEEAPKPDSPTPKINNLVKKTTTPPTSPKEKTSSPKEQKKSSKGGKYIPSPKELSTEDDAPKIENVTSAASTPRSASRSCTLFADRVPTPKLKNMGARHHLDRTTKYSNSKPSHSTEQIPSTILAGRCETPRLHQIGGYRHHLDGTTPSANMIKSKTLIPDGTQPFKPVLNGEVSGKLDFSSPKAKKEAWSKDLDTSVLSRASSCTSLASATLEKAKGRSTDFWK